jgi:hypothetical protein
MTWRSEARGSIVSDWNAAPYLDHNDPYLVWLDISRFAGAGLPEGRLLPVIEETKNELQRFRTRAPYLGDLQGLANPDSRAEVLRFEVAAGTVSDESVRQDTANVQAPPPPGPPRRSGNKPVVGFIDYGCAFAHRQFRAGFGGLGTRVKALWDQGGDPRLDRGELQWRAPPGYWYGAETHRDVAWAPDSGALSLDAYIARFVHAGVLDEEACYRQSGYQPIVGRRKTHGTHTMDLATGWPSPLRHLDGAGLSGQSKPHEADIVFVQLPRHVGGKQVSGLLRANVFDAVSYIIDCTPDHQPVVINLSYGANAGPHDGSSVLEQALDWQVQSAKAQRNVTVHLVIAAGNAREERMHATAELVATEGDAEFEWHNLPDDPSDSFVELWLPCEPTGSSLRVMSPDGEASPWVEPGQAATFDRGGAAAALIFPRRACQSARGAMALLAVARTAAWPDRVIAPYGAWRIELCNRSSAAVAVDAWCERDIPAFGGEGMPRQGHFVDTARSRIERDCTLNSIAHGQTSIVAGSRVIGGAVAGYSGTGPGRGLDAVARQRRARSPSKPLQRGPELLAPGDESPAQPGLLAAAIIGTDRVRLNGTSAAAALTTRRIVDAAFYLPKAKPGPSQTPSDPELHPDTDLL